jgi:hypothetical protein
VIVEETVNLVDDCLGMLPQFPSTLWGRQLKGLRCTSLEADVDTDRTFG